MGEPRQNVTDFSNQLGGTKTKYYKFVVQLGGTKTKYYKFVVHLAISRQNITHFISQFNTLNLTNRFLF
jgi:threonine aldolase